MNTKKTDDSGSGSMRSLTIKSLRFCVWAAAIGLAVTWVAVDRHNLVVQIDRSNGESERLQRRLRIATLRAGGKQAEFEHEKRQLQGNYRRIRELMEFRMNSTENLKFRDIPMGRLGHPLGTVVKIDGQVPVDDYLMAKTPVFITHVNGRELEQKVLMTVRGPERKKGDRVSLHGYETGMMAGVPDALWERGYGRELQQPSWRMAFEFVALEDWSEEEKTDPPAEELTRLPAPHTTGDRELSEDS